MWELLELVLEACLGMFDGAELLRSWRLVFCVAAAIGLAACVVTKMAGHRLRWPLAAVTVTSGIVLGSIWEFRKR